jgi:hypothetical protein
MPSPGRLLWYNACTFAGLAMGYGFIAIPDPQDRGWTLMKTGGFMLALIFGWLMDECRRQLALIGQMPATR